jgi:uncharacterized protein (TIGR02996 family)
MGHSLHALIGPSGPVSKFAEGWREAKLLPLPQGFALVPLTAALHDEVATMQTDGTNLPAQLLALLRAIGANPKDDGTRLILADWLEENAETEQAQFIRMGWRGRPFERLSLQLAVILGRASGTGPLAYIETEYHGGAGVQSAALWKGGQLFVGPLKTPTLVGQAGTWAINRVLRQMGVVAQRGLDEFDTVHLGRFTETELIDE